MDLGMDPGLDLELLWIQPLLANDPVLPVLCAGVEVFFYGYIVVSASSACWMIYRHYKRKKTKKTLEDLTKRSIQDLEKILLLAKETKENPNSSALDEIIRTTYTLLLVHKDVAAHLHRPFSQRLQNTWNAMSNFTGQENLAVQLLFTEQLPSLEVRSSLKGCLQKWARQPTYFRSHDTVSSLDESKPLLVVCLSVSRMDSDIDNGLSQLTLTDDMRQHSLAVLMLHMCSESSLPRLPTSTHIGKDSKYADITFIDLAYDKEFYNCEMNKRAKDALNEFLERCRHRMQA